MEATTAGRPLDPWGTLKASADVMVKFDELDPGFGGGRRRAAIVIEKGLAQVRRNAVLAHELLHHRDGYGSWDSAALRRRCGQLWNEAARLWSPSTTLPGWDGTAGRPAGRSTCGM